MRSFPLCLALALASLPSTLVLTRTAHAESAEDKNTARELGKKGQEALDKKDYKAAEDLFTRADTLYHAPTLTLGLARALAGQAKFVAAMEAYNRIIREARTETTAFQAALDDAKKEIETVSPKVAGVTITVSVGGGGDVQSPKVTLDDKPVNAAALGIRRSIDPGSHVVRVTAEGYKPAEFKFNVSEGGSANAPIRLEKEGAVVVPPPSGPKSPEVKPPTETKLPPPPPPAAKSGGGGSNTLAYAAFGLGGAGLVTGVVTGVLAMGKHSDLEKACPNGVCGSDQASNIDSYKTMGLISTIGFAVAGVGAAAGAVLLLTNKPSVEKQVGIRPFVSPTGFGAVGRF